MSTTIDLSQLGHFTGSQRYYRHWIGNIVLTEGVHYLASNGAGWLVDAIGSYQHKPKLKKGDLSEFQIWTLVSKDSSAVLTCKADSNTKPVVTQKIEYTDFPEGTITLYLELGSVDGVNEHRVLMLPSER